MMAVGWLFIAVAGPQALLSPFFGRLADRFDRRALWIGCDVTSAALALGLPLWLACGGAPGAGLYSANLALATVGALFFPASSALIKERIPAGRLRRFNARYEMGTQAGMLLSAARRAVRPGVRCRAAAGVQRRNFHGLGALRRCGGALPGPGADGHRHLGAGAGPGGYA
ncbi:MFS transporter [Streptomyces sp. NBRC 110028]|uniref:MFS transporter n=1 Tax=Streptomyces sp. NBRC 110028 TaxID=1621260 RepID=UPI0018FEEA2A|nr:MFS transporter [Streptomyces sp. NBRC 110028]